MHVLGPVPSLRILTMVPVAAVVVMVIVMVMVMGMNGVYRQKQKQKLWSVKLLLPQCLVVMMQQFQILM